jgi:hydrogenase 3 maturation protease
MDQLCLILERLRRDNQPVRVAIVGLGQELRGDDAIGLIIAEDLQIALDCVDQMLILYAGSAPENYTGVIRRFAPNFVLLIDAAQMDEKPGEIRWLPWQETGGFSASTHSLPLHVFAQYLAEELYCEVGLLGIQPADISLDAGITPVVREAAHQITRALTLAFSPLPSEQNRVLESRPTGVREIHPNL